MSDPALVGKQLRRDADADVDVAVLLRVPGQMPWALGAPVDPDTVADTGPGAVRGDLLISGGTDPDVPAVHSRLRCDCRQYAATRRCRHTALAERLALAQVRAGRTQRPDPTAVSTGPVEAPAVHLAPLDPDLSNLKFARDPGAFAAAVRQARAEAARHPDAPVPLLPAPALYGYGAGRRFGVEVEYMVDDGAVAGYGAYPGDRHLGLGTATVQEYVWGEIEEMEWNEDKQTYVQRRTQGWIEEEHEVVSADGEDPLEDHQLATARIGQSLYEQDLVEDPGQREYGAAKNDGYASRSWSLSDSAPAWRQLREVCAAVADNGGTGYGASAHVHVSAPEFGQDVRAGVRLLALMGEHEDDLHRMAHHPGGSRDLAQWAAPNPPPHAQGYIDVHDVQTHHGHYRAVNFTAVGEHEDLPDADHLEFRLFDASLQPGRVQAQIKLAAALTDYAVRHRDEPAGPRRPLGTAMTGQGVRFSDDDVLVDPDAVDAPAWEQGTANVRHLIDRLFRRDVDKLQMAALWAAGRYRNPLESSARGRSDT